MTKLPKLYSAINAINYGKAGEHLVCADILMKDHKAFLSDHGTSFDVIAIVRGIFYTIQVKSVRTYRNVPQRVGIQPGYLFNIMRMGKYGKKKYSIDMVDLFALVALDTKTIGYFNHHQIRPTMLFRVGAFKGKYWGDRLAEHREDIRKMRKKGRTYKRISVDLGITLSRALQIGQSLKIPKNKLWGRYLDQFTLDSAIGV